MRREIYLLNTANTVVTTAIELCEETREGRIGGMSERGDSEQRVSPMVCIHDFGRRVVIVQQGGLTMGCSVLATRLLFQTYLRCCKISKTMTKTNIPGNDAYGSNPMVARVHFPSLGS